MSAHGRPDPRLSDARLAAGAACAEDAGAASSMRDSNSVWNLAWLYLLINVLLDVLIEIGLAVHDGIRLWP